MNICLRCLISTEDLENHLCLPSSILSKALAAAELRGAQRQREADIKALKSIYASVGREAAVIVRLESLPLAASPKETRS